MMLFPSFFKYKNASYWLRLELTVGLVGLYIFFWTISGVLAKTNDLDLYYIPVAKQAISGKILAVYSQRYLILGRSYPYANGPLTLIPLSAAAEITKFFGWQNEIYLQKMVLMAIFAPFSLFMAKNVVLTVEKLKNSKLSLIKKIFAYSLVLFSPPLWIGVLVYGHVELPILFWLLLLSVRKLGENRPLQSGLIFGLAVLDRTESILYLVPIVLVFLIAKHTKIITKFLLTTISVSLLGLLTFLISDPKNLIFSLITYRASLPANPSALGNWDTTSIVAFSFFLCLLVSFRRKFRPDSYDLFAMFALSSLAFCLFIKTALLPYYFIGPYIFMLIFWLGCPNEELKKFLKFGILTLIYFSVLAIFANYNLAKKHNLFFDQFETLLRLLVAVYLLAFFAFLTLIKTKTQKHLQI